MELSDGTVTLRPWRADDAPAVHAACQDPEIQHWIPLIPRPYELEHARAFVADELGLGPYQWAIEAGGRLAGSIGMQVARTHSTSSASRGSSWWPIPTTSPPSAWPRRRASGARPCCARTSCIPTAAAATR